MSRETLQKYIIKLGFEFKKINRKLKVYEWMDIVAARHRFLLDVQKFRDEGYKIYYQDKTWCNAHHTHQFCLQHLSNPENSLLPAIQWNGGFAVPSVEGQCLIICHAGSEDGFVQNSLLCFIGKSNTSDYHNEMNAKHFEEWWEEKLLPNLQDKSVVNSHTHQFTVVSLIIQQGQTPVGERPSSIKHGSTSAFFTTFRTYSNVDPLECIFMAPLALFTLWRYPQRGSQT